MIEYENPVPVLNLEPYIQAPLYWKNPFDYIILFYWILWYPQAITAYIKKGRPDISLQEGHSVKIDYFQLPRLESEYSSSNLGFIAYLLWVSISLLINLGYLVTNNWISINRISLELFSSGLLCTVLAISVIYFYANAIAAQLPYLMLSSYFSGISIWMGITLMSAPVLTRPVLVIWLGVLFALAIGFIIRIILLYSRELLSDYLIFTYLIACMIVLLAALFLQWLFTANSYFAINATIQNILLLIFVTAITSLGISLRLDDWLFFILTWDPKPRSSTRWNMPHVSLLPFPPALNELKKHLQSDWKKGLKNAEEIIKYTGQEFYVLNLISELLNETPDEDVVDRVSDIYDIPIFRNQILSLVPKTNKRFRHSTQSWLSKLFLPQNTVIEELAISREPLSYIFELDTPARSTIAGYQYLEQKYLEMAKIAFQKVNSAKFGSHGKDLINLTIALLELLDGGDIALKAPLKMPAKPTHSRYKNVWMGLLELRQFVRCMWVFRHSQEPIDRRLIADAAKNHLDKALDFISSISEDIFIPFAVILNEKANGWKREINEDIEIPEFPPLKPINNPFVFMEPLSSTNLPISREKEKKLLRAAWTPGNFQPVLLYGQKHIGKTSVVFSMRTTQRSKARIVYINLKHLGVDISIPKLLTAICEDIEHAVMYPSIQYEELIKTPYATFTAFIKRLCWALHPDRFLVIVLDEIDYIEKMSAVYDTQNNILKFLWETAQAIPNLGFVFVTTKTPAEIYIDYSNPFRTGLSPIQIGFSTEEESVNLLRNPTTSFLPYCLDEAIKEIYQETNGHPYLMQIIAHSLVENFNAQVGNKRAPLFTKKHVVNVLKHSQFIRRQQHYCENIWMEITTADPLCGSVLLYIVLNHNGVPDSEVQLLNTHINKIEKLANRSVVEKRDNNNWYISIQMFGRWINDRRGELAKVLLSSTIIEPSLDCIRVESDLQRKAFCSLHPVINDFASCQNSDLYIIQDENGYVLARCAIWHQNSTAFFDEEIGLIGLYAAKNGIAGIQLLKFSYQALLEKHCDRVIGPVDGSMSKGFGLIIRWYRNRMPHFLTEPQNQMAHITQFIVAGFQPTHYFVSLKLETGASNNMFSDTEDKFIAHSHIVRSVCLEESNFELGKVYDALIAPNLLYDSMNGREDFIDRHQKLLSLAQNSIALTIEFDKHLYGFLFAIEDNSLSNSVSEMDTLIIVMLQTTSGHEHLAFELLYEAWKYALKNKISRIIVKQLYENSELCLLLQKHGAVPIRKYATFSRFQR